MILESFGAYKPAFVALFVLGGAFVALVSLALIFGRFRPQNLASGPGDNATSSVRFVRFYRNGSVQMTVAPLNMHHARQNKEQMMFSVALNDPDLVLRQRNWSKTVQLSDNNGSEWQPVSSNESIEGVTLAFNVTNSPQVLKLSVQGIEDFEWDNGK